MMKFTSQIRNIAVILLFMPLLGCRSVTVDEKTASIVQVGPIAITNSVPLAKLVRSVLLTIPNRRSVPIDCVFVLRDRKVSDEPVISTLSEESISTFAEWGNSSFSCRSVRMENALRVILCDGLDFHVDSWTRPGRLLVTVGPAELVQPHPKIKRRTYKIPEEHAGNFTNLPPILAAKGISMAYDPVKKWLTVIDNEWESVSSEMLELIGAKRIDKAMQENEL